MELVDVDAGAESGNGFLRCFGRQVKLLREAAGLTQAELGALVGYGEAQIASVEQGRRIPKPGLVADLDRVLGAGGVLVAMKGEVERARYPGFFREFARLEAEAVELHAYDVLLVNGLLQCEEYARAVFEMWRPLLDEETVEQRLGARLMRQKIFSRKPAPLMSFVIEEAALRRPLGGRRVLQCQLEQLLIVGHQRNVEIQVMPIERDEHASLAGPFTLLLAKTRRRMAYVEAQSQSIVHSDAAKVQNLEATYGVLRAQALTPKESLGWIERFLGEL
ncbi:helix-turn-helix domain-containing protein [Streptomyces sp. SID8379]|uniref:helix-turn-helix domain-containing protein n=1 Tax=unclassified Streptomyces TaxID=2593676 RepID=UPI000368465C|nr:MULTISPECIES: helix-turn-helix transcriptional regulator [unclassified Streptomyces]MYW64881.1 helix-turn-helix domain-containing protein [Streptomyces sp. SID8379]